MATLEELNAMLQAPRIQQERTAQIESDFAPLVRGLADIAARLDALAKNDDGMARHLAPIAQAIKSIEIPAPVINVAAPSVTVEAAAAPEVSVEIEHMPTRAEIIRDASGFIKYVDFIERPDVEVEVEDEPEME